MAQHHLTSAPPVATGNQIPKPTNLPDGTTTEENDNATPTKNLQFPLVRLYDYLHMFCLNLQLEVLYLQSTSLIRSRWADQLSVEMNPSRTTLWLSYWHHGFQSSTGATGNNVSISYVYGFVLLFTDFCFIQQQWTQRGNERGNYIEISIVDDEEANEASQNNLSSTTVQDELRLLSLSAGVGASLDLNNLTDDEALKVVKALKYPKAHLAVHWQRSGKLFSNYSELHDYQIVGFDIIFVVLICTFAERLFKGCFQYQC